MSETDPVQKDAGAAKSESPLAGSPMKDMLFADERTQHTPTEASALQPLELVSSVRYPAKLSFEAPTARKPGNSIASSSTESTPVVVVQCWGCIVQPTTTDLFVEVDFHPGSRKSTNNKTTLCFPRETFRSIRTVVPASASTKLVTICIETTLFRAFYLSFPVMCSDQLQAELRAGCREANNTEMNTTDSAGAVVPACTVRSDAATAAVLLATRVIPMSLQPVANNFIEAVRKASEASWWACSAEKEFARQELSSQWKISKANSDFSVCSTYPPLLVIPKGISDETLVQAASSRSRNRALVLCYFHKLSGTAIVRSSQPVDFVKRMFAANAMDAYMQALRRASPSGCIRVFDLRPIVNAVANVFRGGGYEAPSENVVVGFSSIGNIKEVREAYIRLFVLLNPPRLQGSKLAPPTTPSEFLAALSQTGWLDIVYLVISAAVDVARAVHGSTSATHSTESGHVSFEGAPKIAHVYCSDGWDRTSQVCALAQVLLDPYFRTIRGLCTLIDKEFVQLGHMFRTRSTYFDGEIDGAMIDSASPIFLMFLDSLWQIVCLYPTLFEYDSAFLLFVMDAMTVGCFGNFASDCHKQVVEGHLDRTTLSLWGLVEVVHSQSRRLEKSSKSRSMLDFDTVEISDIGSPSSSPDMTDYSRHFQWENPRFNPKESEEHGVILSSISPMSVSLWKEYYQRLPVFADTTDRYSPVFAGTARVSHFPWRGGAMVASSTLRERSAFGSAQDLSNIVSSPVHVLPRDRKGNNAVRPKRLKPQYGELARSPAEEDFDADMNVDNMHTVFDQPAPSPSLQIALSRLDEEWEGTIAQ